VSSPYIPRGREEERRMLAAIGVDSFEDLLRAIPPSLRLPGLLELPGPRSEYEVARHLESLAAVDAGGPGERFFLGGGIYDHWVPAAIDHVASRSEYYTAYTPYQAEVGQATLTAIFEFQSMLAELTKMDLVNASMYDGASALAEAALMAYRVNGRKRILVAGPLHPNYLQVLRTYTRETGIELLVDPAPGGFTDREWVAARLDDSIAALVLQSPNFFGGVEDGEELFAAAGQVGALAIHVFQPHALALYRTPGEMGADIAVAEGQALGSPPSFGGPGLGIFAARRKYARRIPGRLIGETVDRDGKRCFVMTLRTREQDIRRAKATSNICTNQSLLALRATMYLALLGPEGLRETAELCLENAHYARDAVIALDGFSAVHDVPFFREFAVHCPRPAAEIVASARQRGVHPGVDLGRFDSAWNDRLLICCSEKHERRDLDELTAALRAAAEEVAHV